MKITITLTKKEMLEIIIKYLIHTKGLTYSHFRCAGDLSIDDITEDSFHESSYSLTVDLNKE